MTLSALIKDKRDDAFTECVCYALDNINNIIVVF